MLLLSTITVHIPKKRYIFTERINELMVLVMAVSPMPKQCLINKRHSISFDCPLFLIPKHIYISHGLTIMED